MAEMSKAEIERAIGEARMWVADGDEAREEERVIAALAAERDGLAAKVADLESELKLNAKMLARQTDLARAAETLAAGPMLDLLEWAWGIIANSYDGDWDKANVGWLGAAELWREKYHALIAAHKAKASNGSLRYGDRMTADKAATEEAMPAAGAMPWRLQIAAMAMAGELARDFGVLPRQERVASALETADALIAAAQAGGAS